MKRTIPKLVAGAALCAAALSLAPRTAHAYDVNGLAVGADVTLAGPGGLALSVGLGRLELQFIVGFALNLPEGGVLEPGVGAAFGLFYTLTDADQTNFQLGGRVGALVIAESSLGFAELTTNAGVMFEVDARVEHRFDDHFAINLQVGLQMQVWPDDPDSGTAQPDFVFGLGDTGLVGGAGFSYWFDGLGGGVAAPLPPPEPEPRPVQARPQPQPQPRPEPEEQPPPAETPYWEQ